MPEPTSEHRCQKYRNARGELIDPAEQGGIGCPVCRPRLIRPNSIEPKTYFSDYLGLALDGKLGRDDEDGLRRQLGGEHAGS